MIDIIDAHHHVWRLERTPWLAGAPELRIFGEYGALRRDYLAAEFSAEARRQGVKKSVYVQVNVARGDEVEEVVWAAASGAPYALIQGVVAFADLGDPSLAETLDRLQTVPALRGVRQQLHWHENPAYRFAREPDSFLRSQWQQGMREVASRGLLFELQVFPSQYGDALRLVDAFPDATFVLLHAGMPDDRSADGLRRWRRGIADFARRDNVYLKLSGLGTFVRTCSIETWKPIIDAAVDAFTPKRCAFGSNFPIEKLWTSYENLIDVVLASLADYDAAERHDILAGVAARLYKLD